MASWTVELCLNSEVSSLFNKMMNERILLYHLTYSDAQSHLPWYIQEAGSNLHLFLANMRFL